MSTLGNFIWNIADQLRGVYKPAQYGNVILPFTILRRLDAQMDQHRDVMRELAAKTPNAELLARQVKKQTGLTFHNTSKYDFARLVADPAGLRENLTDYLTKFSDNIDVFSRFKVDNEIATLAEKDRLYLVVKQFADVDLHPKTISNADMGDLFEELIRKFAEASNETAGEHFTPRDAIHLMVDLLYAEDTEALTKPDIIRSVYDPTAGTGGMLSVAEEHLLTRNPSARMTLHGQELNDQSYAICKSDMIAKGQDPTNIKLGDTLADDQFAGQLFDYCLANPPYGVDWKASEKAIKAERAATGEHGRFGPGLPRISDGQMLFLTHLASKMRLPKDGGGRAGIVLNGSPLFTGAAGSGESEIRRHLLEHDLVDVIVALPTDMFYNTGIATYVWILDNTKSDERKGLVQLIDGTSFFSKMRKSLGSKRREIGSAHRDRLVRIYSGFDDQTDEDAEFSKVLPTAEFGFWTITVERPLRDEDGKLVTDRKGTPKPDSKLRDTENIPFLYGRKGERDAPDRDPTIKAYLEAEVLPHMPDAWLDEKKTKVGYEIPFTRHFYKYVPPRPLEEIDAELNVLVKEIIELLQEIES
ncbi:type I restriction-modification system subunit M [Aeromicrobium sp.]|uniref:type I restriction-modification system subunit M n=1 Tax=Aeromicrobium sp. TaxID=1871063 RepID=UPI002FC5EE69